MRKASSLAILLLFFCPAIVPGQEVKLPPALTAQPGGPPIPLVATATGANVVWFSPDPGLTVIDGGFFGGDSKKALLFAPNAGRYRVWAVTALKDKVSERAECVVTVGTPPEPPPVPPGPTPPGPTPPGPGPSPSGGLTVLVVYDAGKVGTLTEAQQNVLYSKRVRDWLDAHTPAGPDGKTHNWRIFDQGVDASADPGPWKALLARPRAAVPALVVADGKDPSKVLYEGPLPADADKALELLKKYAREG